jgi:hypothetical protein
MLCVDAMSTRTLQITTPLAAPKVCYKYASPPVRIERNSQARMSFGHSSRTLLRPQYPPDTSDDDQ